VGVYEANAIALEIEKIATPRPMTHDLIKTILMGMDARVDRVVVNELKDDTFFATIWVEKNGEMMSIDSRPSDALAIALRTDSPIFVDESVLKNSRMSGSSAEKGKDEELRRLLENLNEEDFGRYKM
jgi:bifunctional DNase/RNase